MARPPGLTTELIDRISEALASGSTDEHAAATCGVPLTTFRRWCRDARDGKPGIYQQLWTSITRARILGEASLAAEIRNHAAADWRAGAWLLTHHPRYRDGWSDAAAERKAEAAILAEVVKVIEAEFSSEPDTRHRLFTALAAAGLSRQGENSNEEA